jgi:hypothetical protein
MLCLMCSFVHDAEVLLPFLKLLTTSTTLLFFFVCVHFTLRVLKWPFHWHNRASMSLKIVLLTFFLHFLQKRVYIMDLCFCILSLMPQSFAFTRLKSFLFSLFRSLLAFLFPSHWNFSFLVSLGGNSLISFSTSWWTKFTQLRGCYKKLYCFSQLRR